MKKLILLILSFCFAVSLNAQVSKTNLVSAGGLSTTLTLDELNTVTNLTLTGTIDARDFKTMRDNMPLLTELDLSGVNIVAYSGSDGTSVWGNNDYQADAIPEFAFVNNNWQGKTTLTSILFPSTITSFGQNAFRSCSGLTILTLPSLVTSIDNQAFYFCTGLTSVFIPSSVTNIGSSAFAHSSGLITVDPSNPNFSSLDGILFNKTQTQLIQCPTSKMGIYSIPSTVTSIGISAFDNCSKLSNVIIPSSITSIGYDAFYFCYGLTTLTIPSSVKSIANGAFFRCSGLKTVSIPSSVTSIGIDAFRGSSGLITVDPSNPNYSSLDGILFDKAQTLLIHCPVSKAGTYFIPSSVTSIGFNAFFLCSGLTAITIPSSVKSIGSYAFNSCFGLTSVFVNGVYPVDLSSSPNVFAGGIDITTCILHVPYGSKTAYQAANQWKDFTNIVEETNGVTLSAHIASVGAEEQSTATLSLTANVNWMAACDQSWLTVSPVSGNDNQTLTFTAQANTSMTPRTAVVTVSAEGFDSQIITVTQACSNAPVSITAGGLSAVFTPHELAAITQLTLTGTIDARDFKTMRDQMPLLAELDLSQATINAYSGLEGTSNWGHNDYPAHTIPETAFMSSNWQGKNSLTSVILPESLLSIGENSFCSCEGLTTLSIPSQVTNIDPDAFSNCNGLTSVSIPASMASIGERAFMQCTGLLNVEAANPHYSSLEGVLFNKNQTVLIQCPISKPGSYVIPSSVISIGQLAFFDCNLLTSVEIPWGVELIDSRAFSDCDRLTFLNIPSSVKTIRFSAFSYNEALTSITVNHSDPLNLNGEERVFFYVNKSTCTLYVPYGSKAAYQAAYQWKDFANMVEATSGFNLSAQTVTIGAEEQSTAKLSLTANVNWTAACDQSWLTVSPSAGNDNQTFIFTAQANTSMTPRTAVVTVSAEGFDSQIITVTQACSNAPVSITAGGLSAVFTPQELAAITKLTLTGTIDARDFKTMRDQMPLLAEMDLSGVSIVAYTGTEGTSIQGNNNYPANVFPEFAFLNSNWQGKKSLISVVFPLSIIKLGKFALYGCSNLISVNIPPTVKIIEQNVFTSSRSLNSISISEGLVSIGSQAFYNCEGTSTIFVPSTVTSIAESAFGGWNGFLNVDERNPNFSSFDGVLYNKTKTKLIQCPTIKSGIFNIPSSVSTIGTGAFELCRNITSIIFTEAITIIERGAFSYCTGITSMNLPNTVTSLDLATFNGSGLTSIIIPNSITTIGESVFWGCGNLTSITIPSSVKTIGSGALGYCGNLTSIKVENVVPIYLTASKDVFLGVNKTTCTLHVPYGTTSLYRAANQWQDFTNIVEDTKGFLVASNSVTIGSTEGSNVSIPIKANIAWQAQSNQSWLTVTPVSGSNDGSITLTARKNMGLTRTAQITVLANGYESQLVYVTQNCPDELNEFNIIKDGNFASDGELSLPWEFWSGNGGTAPMIVSGVPICTPIQDANAMWNYQIWQSNLQALPNTDYVFSFTAWAATNRVISVTFQDPNNNYFRYGTSTDPEVEWDNVSQWKLNITNVPKTYTLHVNFDKMLPNTNQQIGFLLAHTSDIVYIDNVSLVSAADLLLINKAPVAQAGADQIVVTGGYIVKLNGSASSDPNNDNLTYLWTAPPGITLSSTTTANPTFLSPEVTTKTNYTFTLVVNDGTLDSPPDVVAVTVQQDNVVPIASAGSDLSVNEGAVAALDGSASLDPDNGDLTFLWSGPSEIVLSSTTAAQPTFTAPEVLVNTDYTFSLVVNDGSVSSATDKVVVTVKQVNKEPVSNAGADQSVNEGATATLDGSASSDLDKNTLTFLWTAPAGITLSSTTVAKPSFTAPEGLVNTDFTFTLVVSDGALSSKADQVVVTVKHGNNEPVANAGADQSVNGGATATLDGSASSDPEKNTLTYLWTAPTGVTLSSTTVAKPSFTAPEVQIDTDYTFTLVVSDGALSSKADQVVVTVKQVNKAPIAYAGVNKSVKMGSSLQLDGTGSRDVDKDPITYLWTAPDGIKLSSTTVAKPTFIAPTVTADKNLIITLMVNDGKINSPIDTIVVTIHYDNSRPIAVNQLLSVNEDNELLFDLQATDDMPVSKLVYTITANPVHGTLTSSFLNYYSYKPAVNYFGNDKFEFEVKDENGKTDIGTVDFVVKPINDKPVLIAPFTSYSLDQNSATNMTLEMNDAKDLINAANLHLVVITNPFSGKLSGAVETGHFTYTPATGFSGKDYLQIQVQETNTEEGLKSQIYTLSFNVTKNNQAPFAFGQQLTLLEDSMISFSLSGADPEDGLTSLSYSITQFPGHGEIVVETGNNIKYKPAANYYGNDEILFVVKDKEGLSSSVAKITLTIEPVNDRPEALSKEFAIAYKAEYPFDMDALIADIETPDNLLKVNFFTGKGVFGGTVTKQTGNVYKYNKATNIFSEDYLLYKVMDESLTSYAQVVTIKNIGSLKSAKAFQDTKPLAVNDTVDVWFNQPLSVEFVGLDVAVPYEKLDLKLVSQPKNGSLTGFGFEYYNGTILTSYRAIYTPSVNESLLDSVEFNVKGPDGERNGKIYFRNHSIEIAPKLHALSNQSMDEDQEGKIILQLENEHADISGLTWEVVNATVSGFQFNTETENGQEVLLVTSPANYHGTSQINIVVADKKQLKDSIQFLLTVKEINDAPAFISDKDMIVNEDEPFEFNLTGMDVDGDLLNLTISNLPNTLSLKNGIANNAILTGNLGNDMVGVHQLHLVLTDGKIDLPVALRLVVVNTDDAPYVKKSIDDLVGNTGDKPSTINLSTIFADDDLGDVLIYSVVANSNDTVVTTQISGDELLLAFSELYTGNAELVIVASSNGKTAQTSFNIELDFKTAIDPMPEESKIEIYPNPSRGNVFLKFTNTPKAGTWIRVYNVSGKEISKTLAEKKQHNLNLHGYAPGLYFIKIDQETPKIFKLILE